MLLDNVNILPVAVTTVDQVKNLTQVLLRCHGVTTKSFYILVVLQEISFRVQISFVFIVLGVISFIEIELL